MRRKNLGILLIVLLIIVFTCSFFYTKIKYKNSDIEKGSVVNVGKSLSPGVADIVRPNSTIVFKVKTAKGDIREERRESSDGFIGKSKEDVEAAYKDDGYKVQSITAAEVVLLRDECPPNKYILGIKNGRIAIYKTNSKGEKFIENEARDVTDIKIDNLKPEDIKILENGVRQFDTWDEAQSSLEDYDS